MDEKRTAAYRNILYQFLLDIHTSPLPLADDKQALKIGCFVGPVAYQLHNLTLASANNFNNFDEKAFWIGLDAFNQHNPNTQISYYRETFDLELLTS